MLASQALLILWITLFGSNIATQHVASSHVRKQLGARILSELARREGQGSGGRLAMATRQLLGGGEGYAPYAVTCPGNVTWIRSAEGLSSGEQGYLKQRQQYLAAINTQLASHGLPNPPRTPVIGFALSGGGYRAMITGMGGVMATMNQSTEAAASGIGGWFDGMSYMAGLSGGSWATGSFMANGGPLPLDLVNNVWNLNSNLVFPDENKTSFYYSLLSEVDAKKNEKFPTQITDYWALALGNHLLPTQYRLNTSPNFTMSRLPSTVDAIGNASLPMPIIIAAEREQGEIVLAENATVYEFTPYEFGSWAIGSEKKVRGAFTPLEYLGSELNNGTPNGTCYKGFDQLSFIMGTSSTLFSSAFLQLNGSDQDSVVIDAIKSILQDVSEADNDVALVPNPFANWTAQENPISGLENITLFDAGLTNQNIPLEPLLIPDRNVDAIIAFDNSADTQWSWPNGTALATTYVRAKELAAKQNVTLRMPEVPSENGFVNGELNTRPTFFGCNDTTTPMIVYIPNYPWSFASNTSTYQLEYDNTTAQNVMLNNMRAFTLNGSVSVWPQCLACALTDRAFGYTAQNRSSTCQSCFDTFCWNGQDNSTQPSSEYQPTVGSKPPWLVSQKLTQEGSTTASAVVTPSAGAGTRGVSVGKGMWSCLVGVVGVITGTMVVLL